MGFKARSVPTDIKLKVDEPTLVVPIEPTPRMIMFLSNIDQVVLYPIETVYYFPAKVSRSSIDVVDKLRHALQKVLVHYYFMAGRLRLNWDEQRLELDCNGAGVLFAGASSEMTMDELGDMMAPNPALNDLVLRVQGVKRLEQLPVTTIQVTRFKCGGFSLGFSSNHTLLDGISAGQFLNNFASCARGEALECIPKPNRILLAARNPPLIKYPHIEYVWPSSVPPHTAVPVSYGRAANRIGSNNDDCTPGLLMRRRREVDVLAAATSHGHPLETVAYKRFVVSSWMLAQLKEIAQSQLPTSNRSCTTFEVLAAHFWQCRTAAVAWVNKSSGSGGSELSSLLFAVDFRNLLYPPLSEGFAGNAVLSACAQAPAHELIHKPLGFAVQKVQEARARVTDDYVRSAIDCLEMHKGTPIGAPGVYVSAWWKIPFHTLDFGWGKPVHAFPVLSDMIEFVLFTADAASPGHCLNVLLALPPSQVTIFDDLFLRHLRSDTDNIHPSPSTIQGSH